MKNAQKITYDGINTDGESRWENGVDHHPDAVELMRHLRFLDNINGDYFDWRTGGDGDNGEELLYHLDMFFEMKDKRAAAEAEEDES